MSKTTKAAEAAPTIDSSETTVDQSVTYNTLIVIEQPVKAPAKASAKPHPKPKLRGFADKGPDLIPPVISFAADGDKLTTYHSKDGATAVFREDRQGNEAVTLTLHDAAITLTTSGSTRGYTSTEVDRNGKVRNEKTLVGGSVGGDRANGPDRIDCPGLQRDVNITASVTDQVTRDQLQQFAARHPQLTETLKTVKLPATTAGGIQVDFKEALARPTNFQACPTGAKEGIVKVGQSF